MTDKLPTNVRDKAAHLNQDHSVYGTFAEIGAGQEVAANFFKACHASGTIAKTMSAYDMTISDTIYGREKCGRYVVESRLHRMLDREYELLEERLKSARPDAKFFVLADTIATKAPDSHSPGHGWIGCKFRLRPDGPTNKLIAHVLLYGDTIDSQQCLIGGLGVNLLFGCYHYHHDPENLVRSLGEGLEQYKFQIDILKLDGADTFEVKNDRLNMELVRQGLSHAILFNEKGKIESAKDVFYKKPLLIVRGNFRPPTRVGENMLECATRQLQEQLGSDDITPICEVTFGNLLDDGARNVDDFLQRRKLISAIGKKTLITNFGYYYQLSQHLSHFSNEGITFAMGVETIAEMFKEEYYTELPGGMLEAMGRLFQQKVQVYAHPRIDEAGLLNKADTLSFERHIACLFESLRCRGLIKDIEGADEKVLGIKSRAVWEMIQSGDNGWRELVSPEVATVLGQL